ncbi:MAG: zinc dependent phospholipase C family protein [Chloroflexi bacterium]|nr:zinc dependent phospholipase C family protein [Chloroflexota bacterium]
MPNLPMHIYLASRVAEQLDWGHVHDHLGSCLLGSTAPDIRAMTKWDRQRTHFASLGVESVGVGTKKMFEQHPELADSKTQSPETRAFLLGYVSHLAADEVWITTMFRPYFGEGSPVTGDQLERHLWDRALQLDMDRRVLAQDIPILKPDEMLVDSDSEVAVAFLEEEVLREWRSWVSRFLGWDFSWDRLKRALNRMYRDDDGVQRVVDNFLERMPESLERIYEKVPREKIETYQERVITETLSQAREYLGAA